MGTPGPDPRLLEATITVLASAGWEGVTLEKVAEIAGISRSTVWRQGVTREVLLAALLDQVADDFRLALWPVLNSSEPGGAKLRRGLECLCEVIERHLSLVSASDAVFHQGEPGRRGIDYLEPYARFAREGEADGSLPATGDPDERASLAFNGVAWTYTHLRKHHGWPADKARWKVVTMIMDGVSRE